jgi:SAM-dependent methyltransferase
MADIFGQALLDFYFNRFQPPLMLHNEYGAPEEIPVETYFRDADDYSELEIYALQCVKGRILDIGAAAGRHALHLQHRNFDITAMDVSAQCGELMRHKGVKNIVIQDVMLYDQRQFDTAIMLMNGIGLAGDMSQLRKLMIHLKNLVAPDGQVLLDSTDILYLYEDSTVPDNKYYGELTFYYEYKGVRDEPFKWLYIDQDSLIRIASDCGWHCQVIFEDETDAYLARLTLR